MKIAHLFFNTASHFFCVGKCLYFLWFEVGLSVVYCYTYISDMYLYFITYLILCAPTQVLQMEMSSWLNVAQNIFSH